MSLAQHVGPIYNPPVPLTCHVAVWFWAALEAQGRGLVAQKTTRDRLIAICSIPVGPQQAMLNLPRIGDRNYAWSSTLPAVGTVMVWTSGATHSAVALSNKIAGYNQCQQFGVVDRAYTLCTVNQLVAGQKKVYFVREDIIVAAAQHYGL